MDKLKTICGDDLSKFVKFKGGAKTEKAIAILAGWLDTEKHLFTRLRICSILNATIDGLPAAVFAKKGKVIASGCMKQW